MNLDTNLITLFLTILTVILLLVLTIRFQLIEKYFAPLKFRIKNQLVIDPTLQQEFLKVVIYNSTLNDARVTSFGYLYRQKNIDYFREYLIQSKMPVVHQTIVPSRDSITFTLPLESLGDIVQNINQGRFTVKQVRVFAISSFGQTTVIKSRLVQRHLTKLLGKRKKIEQKRLRQIRNENRRLKNEKFAKQSAILRQRIGFWFKNAYERLKTLLKKRKP
jgi:hypothetical protein